MLLTILLISPVFISILWFVTLAGDIKRHCQPRIYLSWFMLIPFFIFGAHFLYFTSNYEIYPYFDIALQCASLIVFPAYHIYFRLLTLDDKFRIKKHIKWLYIPILVSVIYSIVVFFTPRIEFRTWLFDKNAYTESSHIQILNILRIIIRVLNLMSIVLSVIWNSILIRKYNYKAEQYYSNVDDGKYNNAKMLNYSFIAISTGAIFVILPGRYLISSNELIVYMSWLLFSILLYVIGYMGVTQKPINPTFETENDKEQLVLLMNITHKKLLDKVLYELIEKKVYLNSNLNIMDIVESVGTNRTTISHLINQQYNQNFCSFVNNFRISEFEKTWKESPHFTNEYLAKSCGFGSLNSLKRAIASKTGLSLREWKKTLCCNNA